MEDRRLWILEDHVDLLRLAREAAEDMGFKVRPMQSMQEAWLAIAGVRDQLPGPTHLLSDYQLPDGTSELWLLKARRLWPGATLACSSGSVPPSVAKVLSLAGILLYPKPQSVVPLLAEWSR